MEKSLAIKTFRWPE